MKKSLLFLIAMAVAVSASAGIRSTGNAYRELGKPAQAAALKAPAQVDVITEQPEGTLVSYTRGGDLLLSSIFGYEVTSQIGRVKVVYAEDGKTVYIQDPLCYGEGVGIWVQGELSDDGLTITVPLGQYVSYNAEYDYGLVLAWGTTGVTEYEDEYGPFYLLDFYPDESVEAATYAVNPEDGTLTLLNTQGDASAEFPFNCVATGLAGVWSDDGTLATIEWGTTWTVRGEAVPAVPANPEATEFFDCGTEEGYTRFDFNINIVDVDGNALDTDSLTYSIYTDNDELFTFDYATYGEPNGFDTDVTEIPYGFSGFDFYLRRVYFYRTNEGDNPFFDWRIGIQVHYTVDGIRNSSDIVYLEVYPQSAVNEINAGKTVTGVNYYNMAGQQVAQPSGLTIQVTTYSDGTTTAVKVIK